MSGATKRLRIIGIGSPFTEDRLGLQAVERLQHESFFFSPSLELEFLMLDRPGSGLIGYLESAEAVILIDAMQSGQAAGTVQRLEPSELISRGGMASTHQMGVAETLALADALGALPDPLRIYGIEAGEGLDSELWYARLRDLLQQDLPRLTSFSASS